MQDIYAGDIGDFAKFGLIRELFMGENPKIYTVWMRYDYVNNNKDGHIREYLSDDSSWTHDCDPELVNLFNKSGFQKQRSDGIMRLAEIEGLMPGNSDYFNKDFSLKNVDWRDRPAQRESLMREAFEEAVNFNADLVVFDPDNGFEISTVKKKTKLASGKYIYQDEIKHFYDAHLDLLIYQHLDRSGTAKTHDRWKKLARDLKVTGLWSFDFHRQSARSFMLLVHDPKIWESRVESFKPSSSTHWCDTGKYTTSHFTVEKLR